VTRAFEKTKLNVEEQANVLRESFAHASELGWFCLPEEQEEEEDSVVNFVKSFRY
jgi:hypothetical protein